jgi:hypothetical protein
VVTVVCPTDTPVYSDEPIVVEDAIKDASIIARNCADSRLQREITEIDIDYFKNQSKPRLDLVSSFSLGGCLWAIKILVIKSLINSPETMNFYDWH